MDDLSPTGIKHPHPLQPGPSRISRSELAPYAVTLFISLGLLIYALTRSFVWDEGFHLLAAQLINAGKKPYIDFCFPQTPLNAYWNSGWMRLFGQTWRVTHVAATLLVIGSLILLVQYLLRSFPVSRWRTASTITALLLFGLHTTVVEFGPIAQAYAMCLFTTLAAFRLSIKSIDRPGPVLASPAGLFAGIAAGSSLLSAPVACVLFVWLLLNNQNGSRFAKSAAFMAGTAVAFLPVFWLFGLAPHQVFFNVVQYQTLFRRVDWAGATAHDVDVLTSWVDSGVALLLGSLAIAGLIYAKRNKASEPRFCRELYLCGWISAALIVYISTAHPTFGRYYIVVIPFLAILAAAGVYLAGSRLFSAAKPRWAVLSVAAIVLVAIFRALFTDRDSASWRGYEEMATKVATVTPPAARLFADEQIYFLLNRAPPPGMEFSYSHKLHLPPSEGAVLHIVPEKELEQQVKAGVYATLQTCNDDRIDDWNLGKVYKQRADIGDCSIFWDFTGAK